VTWIRRLVRSRALKLAVAAGLVACLCLAADWRAVAAAVARLDPAYLAAALALFVPQTILSALRWQGLATGLTRLTLTDAIRHTLASSALNLAAPSKLGDLTKAAMLPDLSAQARARAVARVALEKASDVMALAGLLLWGAAGLGATWLAVLWLVLSATAAGASLYRRRGPLPAVRGALALASASLALWILHLAQIDLFLKAAGVFVSWDAMLARVPVAIFAGLLPVSFCGIGTRDTALVWLFADVAPSATMAAVGLLTALRYLLPGAAGIPLLAGAWPRQPAPTASA
jgi:hypothetical protein